MADLSTRKGATEDPATEDTTAASEPTNDDTKAGTPAAETSNSAGSEPDTKADEPGTDEPGTDEPGTATAEARTDKAEADEPKATATGPTAAADQAKAETAAAADQAKADEAEAEDDAVESTGDEAETETAADPTVAPAGATADKAEPPASETATTSETAAAQADTPKAGAQTGKITDSSTGAQDSVAPVDRTAIKDKADDSAPDAGKANTGKTDAGKTDADTADGDGVGGAIANQVIKKPKAGRARPGTLVVALSVLLVVLVAAGVALFVYGQRINGADQERALALESARQVATGLTTISAQNADAQINALNRQSTGAFRDQISQYSAMFQAVLKQGQVGATSEITAAGIEKLEGDTANALVTVSATITSAEVPSGQVRPYRLAIALQREGDHWLASNVEFVQ